MSTEQPIKKRPFDLREGARKYSVCLRLTKAEIMYLDKICKKTGDSRSAIIMQYFNAYKNMIK